LSKRFARVTANFYYPSQAAVNDVLDPGVVEEDVM
jgi:hypothetical protein